jgi:DNA-binding XRE family transcriptional regulator
MEVDYQHRKYPNRLKVIRRRAGYTQRQLAVLLGHNNTVTVSEWENEKKMPSGTNLIKLCMLYQKLPQELYPEYCKRIEQYFRFI